LINEAFGFEIIGGKHDGNIRKRNPLPPSPPPKEKGEPS